MTDVDARTKTSHAEASKTSAQASMWQAQTAAERQNFEDRKWRETGRNMAMRSIDIMRAQYDQLMYNFDLSRKWKVRVGDHKHQNLKTSMELVTSAANASRMLLGR